MVANIRKFSALVFAWSVLAFSGCSVDMFGLFGANDLSVRWKERNTFNFLSDTDREYPVPLGNTYSFIVATDTHITNGDAWGLEKLQTVVQNDPSIKFAVFTGDITQNGKRVDYEKFFDVTESLGIPCYPVIGNHDIYFGTWPVWEELIGSTCYRVNAGGATLFILDSANAFFGAQQLDWLEGELKKTSGRVFVFTHTNLFVKSMTNEQQLTDPRERARIVSLLKGRCDAMFTGHVHARVEKEFGGVQYITPEAFIDTGIYCKVDVSASGVNWTFLTIK